MLLIQPEDRPTAAGALRHGWLAGVKTGNEDSADGQEETTQSRGETTLSRKRKVGLATQDSQKKRRSGRNQIVKGDTRCIPVDVASEANAGSQCGGDPTASKAVANICVTTALDASSVGSSVVQVGPRNPESIPHNSQAIHPVGHGAKGGRKIRNIPHTLPKSSTPNTKPNFLIV